MKTATSGFISAISDGCPYHTVKFYYNNAELDINVKAFNYYGLMIGGENINIGETCASHIEFELYNPTITLENKEIQVKGGIDVNGAIEYIPLGYFTVTKPVIESEIYKYTAYDRMIGLERLYVSSLASPTTITVMNEIATQLGYTFASTITGISLDANKIKGYTYREMLGFISALCGANCIFNGNGEIEFKWFVKPTSDLASIGTDRLYENGLELNSDEDLTVGYIKCATGQTENTTTDENGEENTETVDVILSVGSGNFGINISNPLMTQEVLENIYNTYFNNFTFRPCKVNLLGNILLECEDIVTVNNGTNTYNVPIMSIQHSIDGGVITNIETVAQNETEQEINYTSPTVKLMDRVYYEILEANKALVNELIANSVTTEYLKANYAQINLANIEKACITTAMIGTEAVKTSQIADGSITDAKIVELTANKIKAGTLDVERLIITQNNQKYLFHVNEDGTTEYQKLNGNILEDRSITADKIVANAITANEIATATITANEIAANTITSAEIKSGSIKAVDIDVANLFAQDITATGTISGLTLKGAKLDISNAIEFYNGSNYFGKIGTYYYSTSGNLELSISANKSLCILANDNITIASSVFVVQSDIYFVGDVSVDGGITGGSLTIRNGGYASTFSADVLYEGGTALSSKYASYSHTHSGYASSSHTHSGYASSSHTHSVIKNRSCDWQCSDSGNLIPRTNSSDSPKNIGNSTGYVNNLYYKSQTPVSSDRRIKNHIKDLSINESCLLLKGLQPKVYTFKDDDDSVIQHGLYAQDMRDYLKESGLGYISALKICVLDTEDELSTNLDYPEEKVRYGIDYSLLVSDLINGWKYHEEEISNLKSKIEELENFIKGV